MKILVLNGNPFPERDYFDAYVNGLVARLNGAGRHAESLMLRDMKISPCLGCFNCWVKTPGTCSIHDDEPEVTKRYIASDLVILASPLIMGFVSAILKNALDRNIPVIHPHLEAVDGEVHHLRRYGSYPDISFLLEKEPFTDDEDISIITDIFKRESINVRASLRFVRFIDSDPGEVLNALDIH